MENTEKEINTNNPFGRKFFISKKGIIKIGRIEIFEARAKPQIIPNEII